jgi:hypothetical protein
VGAITSRVTQDTDRVWGFLVEGVPYLVTNSLLLIGISVFHLFDQLATGVVYFVADPHCGGGERLFLESHFATVASLRAEVGAFSYQPERSAQRHQSRESLRAGRS